MLSNTQIYHHIETIFTPISFCPKLCSQMSIIIYYFLSIWNILYLRAFLDTMGILRAYFTVNVIEWTVFLKTVLVNFISNLAKLFKILLVFFHNLYKFISVYTANSSGLSSSTAKHSLIPSNKFLYSKHIPSPVFSQYKFFPIVVLPLLSICYENLYFSTLNIVER